MGKIGFQPSKNYSSRRTRGNKAISSAGDSSSQSAPTFVSNVVETPHPEIPRSKATKKSAAAEDNGPLVVAGFTIVLPEEPKKETPAPDGKKANVAPVPPHPKLKTLGISDRRRISKQERRLRKQKEASMMQKPEEEEEPEEEYVPAVHSGPKPKENLWKKKKTEKKAEKKAVQATAEPEPPKEKKKQEKKVEIVVEEAPVAVEEPTPAPPPAKEPPQRWFNRFMLKCCKERVSAKERGLDVLPDGTNEICIDCKLDDLVKKLISLQ